MEGYILDSLLRRIDVIDKYESLIWTERFSDLGDFELDLLSSYENRNRFVTGTKFVINNSYRVMTVDTVEDTTDAEGKSLLKVKGHSIETVIDDRVAKNTLSDTTTEPSWVIVDTPGNVARTMFDHICRTGALDPGDAIPFIMPGTIFPDDTILEPTTIITWTQNPDSLLTAIKAVCDAYDLGFRLVRNFDQSQLYFDIYAGSDRTTRQSVLPPVVFSVNLENIQNTTEFTTVEKTKNVAYVFSAVGFTVVYGDGVEPDVEGFERRVLMVNASDVTADTVDIPAALEQAGYEALAAVRAQTLFDGEINQDSNYKYGVDYQLGDIVEMRNKDGIITYKRVTEQIFVCDVNGERSYPTLSLFMFDSAGNTVWLSWNNKTTVWEDYDLLPDAWADL